MPFSNKQLVMGLGIVALIMIIIASPLFVYGNLNVIDVLGVSFTTTIVVVVWMLILDLCFHALSDKPNK